MLSCSLTMHLPWASVPQLAAQYGYISPHSIYRRLISRQRRAETRWRIGLHRGGLCIGLLGWTRAQNRRRRPAFGVWLDTAVMERDYFLTSRMKLAYRQVHLSLAVPRYWRRLYLYTHRHRTARFAETSGFYDKELLGYARYGGQMEIGSLSPACLPSELTSTATVKINLSHFPLDYAGIVRVQVWVGAETFGGFALGDGFQTVAFSVPVAELKARACASSATLGCRRNMASATMCPEVTC